ncbi:MAG: TIGR00341 family protein [Chloroflexi bacterium]|nr:TIGR00341 family protein [Chloroflexota bacterium]
MRIIEVVTSSENDDRVRALFAPETGLRHLKLWHEPLTDGKTRHTILVIAEDAEDVMDAVEEQFSSDEGFCLYVVNVEAVLPRPRLLPAPEADDDEENRQDLHVSREELYTDVIDSFHAWPIFILLVTLAAIVIAIGMALNDVTVVIGGMVISPLLGSLVALSLSNALADTHLGRIAIQRTGAGLLVGFCTAALIGQFFDIPPTLTMILQNSRVDLGSIALALAAGAAGALAFTRGIPQALVGVAVAVALLPPVITAGMMVGSGEWAIALRALLLLVANLISITLAGVVVFVALGVRPSRLYKAGRARRSTALAIMLWLALFGVLLVLVLSAGGQPPQP